MKKQFDTIITLKNRKSTVIQKMIPVTMEQTKAELRRRWPDIFCKEPKPLRVGIHKELLEIFNGTPFSSRIRAALSKWTMHPRYQSVIAAGGPRYGLDGQPVGEITEHEQISAKKWLESEEKKKLLKSADSEGNVSQPTQQIPHPTSKTSDKKKAPH